jgi:hypothetical protein
MMDLRSVEHLLSGSALHVLLQLLRVLQVLVLCSHSGGQAQRAIGRHDCSESRNSNSDGFCRSNPTAIREIKGL